MRIDALFFGVFLGYLYHFHPEALGRFLAPLRNRVVLGVVSALLLSVTYVFARDSHVMLSVGLSAIYLGFGGVSLLALRVRGLFPGKLAKTLETLGTGAAYLGRHSYSVYLWHTPVLQLIAVIFRKVIHLAVPALAMSILDVVACCVVGIFFAHIIEFPVLKFRDRFFPMLLQPAAATVPVAVAPAVKAPVA